MYDEGALSEWLQKPIVHLVDDYESLAALSSGKVEGLPTSGNARWQFGVDMIYRFPTCGLAKIAISDCKDVELLFSRTHTVSPFDGGEGGLLWNAIYLDAADELVALAKRHLREIPGWGLPLNDGMNAELTGIFADHGVPINATPLLPIKQA